MGVIVAHAIRVATATVDDRDIPRRLVANDGIHARDRGVGVRGRNKYYGGDADDLPVLKTARRAKTDDAPLHADAGQRVIHHARPGLPENLPGRVRHC